MVKKIKGWHNISAGLFGYRGWRWYKNIGDLLNHMLELLEKADPFQTGEFEGAEKAKNEFLELFSKYSYKFWE